MALVRASILVLACIKPAYTATMSDEGCECRSRCSPSWPLGQSWCEVDNNCLQGHTEAWDWCGSPSYEKWHLINTENEKLRAEVKEDAAKLSKIQTEELALQQQLNAKQQQLSAETSAKDRVQASLEAAQASLNAEKADNGALVHNIAEMSGKLDAAKKELAEIKVKANAVSENSFYNELLLCFGVIWIAIFVFMAVQGPKLQEYSNIIRNFTSLAYRRTEHASKQKQTMAGGPCSAQSSNGHDSTSRGSSDAGSWERVSAPQTCKCYLPNTAFKAPSGHLLLARNMQPGSQVLSTHGASLDVQYVRRHDRDRCALVEITTRKASLKVSATHSVPVLDELSGSCVELLAKDLHRGMHVFVGQRHQSLTNVRPSFERTELIEMAFAPDHAVEAFVVPDQCVHTLGAEVEAVAEQEPLLQQNSSVAPPESYCAIPMNWCQHQFSEEDLLRAMPIEYED